MSEDTAELTLPCVVVQPGDPDYAETSRTFAAQGTPDLIVRPADAQEVSAAVRYAITHGHTLTVRSGGHSMAGFSTGHDGMVVDLRRLDGVELVDAEQRRVRVGAGATWGTVAGALRPHGLALTAGDTTSVGVSGLTLGGGIGWMVRRYGLAIDNLVGARIVTADGSILRASAAENPDLFWAIRGGGGNVGVVVDLDFVAQPVETVVFGTITYELRDVAALLRGWRDHMRAAPDELTTSLAVLPATGGAGPTAMLTCCYVGDEATSSAVLGPLADLAPVVDSSVTTHPYADILLDGHEPPEGIRAGVTNAMVPELDDAMITTIAQVLEAHPGAALELRSLGGAVARVPADATAFAHRDAEAMVVVVIMMPADMPDRALDEALAPWKAISRGLGAYVNFLGTAAEDDVAAVYPEAIRARLAALKRRYDPENVFRRTHNVVPARDEEPAG
ncbi:FAD-binding oxidoreductase [Georgenia alba]|uniref:FAD-binding oxidoreductase n=1 Tax=Georgenia alba TaxID=2233858 RepID=A0ABW2QBY5_9MICO